MSGISKKPISPGLETDLKRLRRVINRSRGVIVAGHVNPDGDLIASQLALGVYLESVGKPFVIAAEDAVPAPLSFLPRSNRILKSHPGLYADHAYDLLIVLDCGDMDRIGPVRDHLPPDLTVVNIDHHRGNTLFGSLNIVAERACSIGEILYYFFRAIRFPLTRTLAEYLYVSIVTDTGHFRYDCMHSGVHRIASELLSLGVVPSDYNIHLNQNKSLSYMKLLTRTLEKMELFENGRIAVSTLGPEDFNAAGGEDDTDGLIEYLGMLDTVSVYVLIKVKAGSDGRISASLRSKHNVDVARIAASFGGGGHIRAAGCRMEGTDIPGFRNKLVNLISRELPHQA